MSSTPRKDMVSFATSSTSSALDQLRTIHTELLPHFGERSWNKHAMVTQNVTTIARLLYLDQLYRQIVPVPGVICEFGVQWGATLSQLINLRAIHEPFNHSRTIVGFDTFEGFPSVHAKDGELSQVGDLALPEQYQDTLDRILGLVETFPPFPHLKKYELVKGDVMKSLDPWLEQNPHAIVSMIILDMDLYEPTKYVLERIRERLTIGSVIAFDELNCKAFPGETLAVAEAVGLGKLRLRRSPLHPYCAWAVYGE